MPHITEDTVNRLRDSIVKGARLVRRFWQDDSAPQAYGDGFHTAEAVKLNADGWVTIDYVWYTEGGSKRVESLHYGPDDVIALVEMKELRPGVQTYAHNDSRLILPGGYMDARPGGNLRAWDVYRADGTQLAEDVTTAEGRALLAEEAPEMIWVHDGDGNYAARGNGRAWKIERRFNGHGGWLYDLSTRPLDVEEWETLRVDCATPQEAKEAAPHPQQA
jgi:hypothetical protein